MNQFIACSDNTLRTRLKNLREEVFQIELELKRREALRNQRGKHDDAKGAIDRKRVG